MTHPRLSVNAMCTFASPFEHDLALWTEMGVRHAGLLVSKLADDPEGKMARLSDAGICASTLITGCFDLGDRSSWPGTHAAHRQAIDLVAAHAGRSIYFTPGRTIRGQWREDLAALAEALAPTLAHGRAKGVRVAIEPSLRTSVSFVNTLRDAIIVAESTGVELIADFGNMWMERDFREVFAEAAPHLALVQFGDVVIGSPGSPPPGGRVQVGKGELPLHRMLGDVLATGYAGPFDLEVVSADLTAGWPDAELRQGIEDASALLSAVGA